MSTFRDDLGVALERIARLEDENRTLRAELDERAPPKRSGNGWICEAACWGVLLLVFLAGAALASRPTTGLDDIGLGCTTPFTYQVNGETRAACLSMPP